jgi:two-component system, LytTR family, sensor histidine kinase AlgZ
MHPILGSARRLAFYLLAWVLIGLLLSAGLGFGRGGDWVTAVLFFVPLGVVYALITQSAWYVCRIFPLVRSRGWHVASAQILAAVFASGIWVAAAGAWARTLAAMGVDAAGSMYDPQRPLLFVVGALLFWLVSVFFYLLIAFDASKDAERANVELTLLAREAELKALRAQIDPHFIFNSLHSISALTATDPPAARRMCLLLADFLRETLRLGGNEQIPLAEELALADRYLAIEQVRLGARLNVARDADSSAASCLVPPLLLQPLVENAVTHGIAQLVEGGTIRVAATCSGSTLTITLENPCDPDRARTRGVGLGLELLRKRLTNHFGAVDAVYAQEREGHFRVEVRIPAVTGAHA